MSNTKIIEHEFDYLVPASVEDALNKLSKGNTKLLAGGTDLIVRLKMGALKPDYVIDIGRLKDLVFMSKSSEGYEIGAGVKLSSIERGDYVIKNYPALAEAVHSIGGTQVRNMGTIVGNLCNASPGADSAPPLLVYETEVEILQLSADGRVSGKRIPITEFFMGPGKTVLEKNQLVSKIIIPVLPDNCASAFKKIARVTLDISKISCAVYFEDANGKFKNVRVAFGATAATPIRTPKIEKVLNGETIAMETVERVAESVVDEISPITDVRSTAEYRREVAPVLFKDTFELAIQRLKGEN